MKIEVESNPHDEAMCPATNELISELIGRVLKVIKDVDIDNATKDLVSSPLNVAINVCVGALFAIVQGRIPKEEQLTFTTGIANGLANNFRHYNEWIKTNGDKD